MTLLIAGIVGVLVGMITYRIVSRVGTRAVLRPSVQGQKGSFRQDEGLLGLLEQIPVPGRFKRHWLDADLSQRLLQSGRSWRASDFVALRWLSLWLTLALGLGIGLWRHWDLMGQTLIVVVVAAGWFGPEIWLLRQIEKRQQGMNQALPNYLDRLTLGLEAGLGFFIALQRSAIGFPGSLGDELRRLLRQLERGHSRAEALDEMSERVPSSDLKGFVAAVKQADRLGTSLSVTLRVQTKLMRARRRRRVQEASRRLPILIVFPLVLLFLPSLLIIYLAPPLLHLFLGR